MVLWSLEVNPLVQTKSIHCIHSLLKLKNVGKMLKKEERLIYFEIHLISLSLGLCLWLISQPLWNFPSSQRLFKPFSMSGQNWLFIIFGKPPIDSIFCFFQGESNFSLSHKEFEKVISAFFSFFLSTILLLSRSVTSINFAPVISPKRTN